MTEHVGEAIVLRTWPFHEADLVVSLFTREQGRVKGVARHAMKSRRRFGGALEPMTYVRASMRNGHGRNWCGWMGLRFCLRRCRERWTMSGTAALQLVAEVLEEAMPEQAPEDAVFRLALAVLDELQVGRVWMPVTYFALWMSRLMGWMPELGHCAACGLDLRGGTVWWFGGERWSDLRGRSRAG